jgi:hypothetical protein
MKAVGGLPYALARACVQLYPQEFRERFADELLQTCRDGMRQHAGPRFWLGVFSDLLPSILRERVEQARLNMKATGIFKGFGFLLIVLWVAILAASLGIALLKWDIPDPIVLMLGESFSSLEMALFNGLIVFGPFVAMLAFLGPSLRVRFNGSQRSMEIRVLPMGRFSALMAAFTGLLSLAIFAIFIASRV